VATAATTSLRFRLLGPLEVLRDGESLQLGGERQRGLLALLLLHVNEVVTTEGLAEQLFGVDASEASIRAIRVAISRLRRLLDDETLETRPGGYLIRAEPEQLDVTEFEVLVAEGRAALEGGDAAGAAASFRNALALFRGAPLADLALLDFIQPEARRLEELRLSALMDRVDADLALRRGGELVPELESLVQAHPFQERLRGQLMLALYRSGRQTDALEVYRNTRELLADELGLEPSRALQQLERAMLQHDPSLDDPRPPVAGDEATTCPFKGLAAFEAADAFYFCGREHLLDEIVARLASSTFLGVIGPSGVGKSSLLRAGLLPALAAAALPGSEAWPVVLVRGGEVATRKIRDAVDSCRIGERVVVVVDQLEEIFADEVPGEERAAFFDELERAAADSGNRALVVVAVRADFYGRFADYPRIADRLSRNHIFVRSLDAEELARAIEVPASRAGLEVERPLVDALVAETAGTTGALPLLQTTLLRLWTARNGRVLRYESYRAIGGLRGAVARLAEETYAKLSAEDQALSRRILLRLAGGEAGALVRRRVPYTDLRRLEGSSRVVDALVSARLLTIDDELVELSHEALLHEWPRYEQWLQDDRVDRRVRTHLTASADDWNSRGRDSADLYRGARLTAALELPAAELSDLERQFLEAGQAQAEREVNRQRSHNRRLRMLLGGVGILLVAAVIAGVLALDSRSTAQHEAQVALGRQLGAEAVSEPRIDLAMLLATEAVKLDDSRQTRGTLLSTLLRSPAALSTFSSPITDRPQKISLSPDGRTLAVAENTDLIRFYDTRTRRQMRAPLPNALHAVPVFSQDGKLLLLFRAKAPHPAPQRLEVRDARTLRHLRWLPMDKAWQQAPGTSYQQPLLVSRDDRHAYLAWSPQDPQHGDGTTHVDEWDLRTGELRSTTVDAKGMFAARLTGDILELVADDRVLTLRAATLQPLQSRTVHFPADSTVAVGALSADGRTMIFGLPTGAVSFVDLRNGETTQGAGKNGAAVQDVGFSPRGDLALSTDENGHVTVWSPGTGAVTDTFTGHEDRVLGLTFSPDGKTAYTCSLDGAIFAWDLSGKRRFGIPFALPSADEATLPVPSTPPLAVAGDSTEFAVRLQALRVGLFSVSGLKREATIAIPAKPGNAIDALAWSARTRLLAVASSDGTLELWNVSQKPRLVRTLRGSPHAKDPLFASEIAFSPDGSRVLEGGFVQTSPAAYAGVAATWRVSDGKLLWRAYRRNWSTDAVAVADNGRTAALSQFLPNQKDETQIVDAVTGSLMRTVRPQGDAIALGFAPDGALETGTVAGIVQTWNLATGKEVGRPLLATPAPVSSLAFQPGTDVFATGGGSGGFVKLWDAKTLRQIGSAFPGSPGHWANGEFTPDGSHLVIVYDDGRGAVWPVSLAAWKARACEVAGRNFTQAEWSRFVSHHAYARVCR
jgi:DNA-binding SARP family transcriptional activator/WD40 repeat protein